MNKSIESAELQEFRKNFDHLSYGFIIVQVETDNPAASDCRPAYMNPAAERLFGGDMDYTRLITDIDEYIRSLNADPPKLSLCSLCYNAAVKGFTEEVEVYIPTLKKYVKFSSYQQSPGYAGLILADVTDSRMYSAALESAVFEYHEIYFIQLDQNYCRMIHPGNDKPSTCASYTQLIDARFDNHIIDRQDEAGIREFLSIDNIRRSLIHQNYTEYKYLRSFGDSEPKWCLTSFTATERKDDIPISVTMSIRDIDELVRQEERQKRLLEEAAQEARRANNAKTDFFSTMSHDMRTPLNVITGMCHLARIHSDDKDRVLDCVDKINTAANHLLTLINEVLDMSKIESGHIDLSEQDFSLPDMINEVVLMCQGMAAAKHQHLLFNQRNPEHENLIGDKNRLIQILLNLISNAIKYTDEGGQIMVDIAELSSEKKDYGVFRFIVKDNGIGMSPEFLKRIFMPFEREKDARVDTVTGTGLGMTITKKILDMMGGSIDIESTEGEGSEFTVHIPIRFQKEPPAQQFFPSEKVLFIDSIDACQDSTCSVLESMQVRCTAASSGKEGVKLLLDALRAGDPFTCVIIDYSTPAENGNNVPELIRTLCGPDLPIIMISSCDLTDLRDETLKKNVDMFFTKPLFRSQLASLFHKLNQRRENGGRSDDVQKGYIGINALLVEDNVLNAEIAGELLTYMGLNVTIATNGKEGVRLFEESEYGFFNCVFMDLQMPVLNGLDAARSIRASARPDSDIPIFAMTANVFTDDVHSAMEAGMQEHIAKPLELDKIEKILNKWFPPKEAG